MTRRKHKAARNTARPAQPATSIPLLLSPYVQAVLLIGLYATTAAAVIGPHMPHPAMLAYAALLAVLLVALSVVDLRQQRLPDSLNAVLLVSGLASASLGGSERLAWSALAAVAGFAALWLLAIAYRQLRGRPGLGLGDAKLLGAGASHVGAAALPSVVLIAAAAALLVVLAAKLAGRAVTWTDRIAFGPFLALGIWIVWLAGPIVL